MQKINSSFLLNQIIGNVPAGQSFNFFKNNKKIQNKLNIGINDYKEFKKTEIIIFLKKLDGEFINGAHHFFYENEKEEKTKEEIKNLIKNSKKVIKKIRVEIDENINNFRGLFQGCEDNQKIIFDLEFVALITFSANSNIVNSLGFPRFIAHLISLLLFIILIIPSIKSDT